MKEYVLDTNAVLRYFGIGKGEGGEKVKELFRLSEQDKVLLLMSVVNLGEVYYVLLKHLDAQTARRYIRSLQNAISLADADQLSALEAGSLKYRYKVGYADSFAAALAMKTKATLVSADPDFEKFGKSLKWLRLPVFVSGADARHRNN
jgi:ribonuclease VapC